MPIYEFYCQDCHRIFNFFSHRVNTEARPLCPKCGRVELAREPSRFATLRHAGAEGSDQLEGADSARIEGAMESVLGEMEQLGDDPNPAQLGRMMRRLGATSGLELGPKMEEIVRRLEAGEDPDSLEREIGDPLEGEAGAEENMEEFFRLRKKARLSGRRKPEVDETLYPF
ncbi:MAG TPA: zinc ribbon domain-containing protein [Acidobacteriota bacterium]